METNGDRPAEGLDTETYTESSTLDLGEPVSGPSWIERIRARGREIGAVGLGAVVFTGGGYLARHIPEAIAFGDTPAALAAVGDSATGMTTTAETTTAQTSANACEPANPAVNFDYVGTNTLPLAREIIADYRHTKPSQKTRLKKQHELYFRSYSHLTEIDIARPARWEKTGRKGTYYITAQFSGRILAKNMVAVEVQEYHGRIALGQRDFSSYDYILEKTTQDGPEKPWGLHWNFNYDYLPPAKCGGADSKLAKGSQSDYKNSLPQAFFDGTLNQAEGVLRRMEQHKPLAPQKNLAK